MAALELFFAVFALLQRRFDATVAVCLLIVAASLYSYGLTVSGIVAFGLQLLLSLGFDYVVNTVPTIRGVPPAYPEIQQQPIPSRPQNAQEDDLVLRIWATIDRDVAAANKVAKRQNAVTKAARAQWAEYANRLLPPNVFELIVSLACLVFIACNPNYAFQLPLRLAGAGMSDMPPFFTWFFFAFLLVLAIMSIYEAGTVDHVRRHLAYRRERQAAAIREQEQEQTRLDAVARKKQTRLDAAAVALQQNETAAATLSAQAAAAQLKADAELARLKKMEAAKAQKKKEEAEKMKAQAEQRRLEDEKAEREAKEAQECQEAILQVASLNLDSDVSRLIVELSALTMRESNFQEQMQAMLQMAGTLENQKSPRVIALKGRLTRIIGDSQRLKNQKNDTSLLEQEVLRQPAGLPDTHSKTWNHVCQ